MREWSKHADILNLIIPMVWERLGKDTKQGYRAINAAVLIEANLDPEDIKFSTANESKCIFIATGSVALNHKFLMRLCKEIEDLGTELYTYKPVVLALGLKTMLAPITDPEREVYDGLLKVDGDPREGQVFLNFDRTYDELDAAIERHELERPLLFQKPHKDRTVLTYFNRREVLLLFCFPIRKILRSSSI